MRRLASRLVALVARVAFVALVGGCGNDRSRDDGPVSVPVPATTASASGPIGEPRRDRGVARGEAAPRRGVRGGVKTSIKIEQAQPSASGMTSVNTLP